MENMAEEILWLAIFVLATTLIVLFAGDPDIHDAILQGVGTCGNTGQCATWGT